MGDATIDPLVDVVVSPFPPSIVVKALLLSIVLLEEEYLPPPAEASREAKKS